MTFIIAAGSLLAVVLAILIWAALRRPRGVRADDMGERLAAELADDVAVGVLTAGDLPAAATDLEVKTRDDRQGSRRRGPWVWALIALVAVVGVVLYWQIGNWRAAIYGDRVAVMQRAETMLAQLQTHLTANPSDLGGWITLGRAKSAMGNYQAAATAYARAVKLDHARNPALLARWGEALILADPGHLTEREHTIFAAVLKTDPDNIRGLWYGGLLALDAGQRKLAIARWQRLLGEDIPAPMAAFVGSRLVALGVPATVSVAQIATVAPRLVLSIELAPGLASQIKPGETLFVYVRDPAGGPPLAAKRISVGGFPLTLTLTGDDTILAGHNLALMVGKEVEVGAFVSATGKVTGGSGGPRASRTVKLKPGKQALTLILAADTTNS